MIAAIVTSDPVQIHVSKTAQCDDVLVTLCANSQRWAGERQNKDGNEDNRAMKSQQFGPHHGRLACKVQGQKQPGKWWQSFDRLVGSREEVEIQGIDLRATKTSSAQFI
jgi:hypothetical protein